MEQCFFRVESGVSIRKAKSVEENHSGGHMEGDNDFREIIKNHCKMGDVG